MLSTRTPILFLLISISINAAIAGAPEVSTVPFGSCPTLLATIEPDGSVTSGSLDALKSAYRTGQQIRIGWEMDWDRDGKVDITHWANADFLSEFEGTIATQLSSVRRQVPRPGEATITLSAATTWTGLIDTSGRLQGAYDGGEPKEHRVRAHWCAAHNPEPAKLHACASSLWRLAFHHDNEGNGVAGEKATLFNALMKGYPLRLAWGVRSSKDSTISIAHAVDPAFVSLMQNEHLFAQLPEHIAQTSYWQPTETRFDDPKIMWRGLIGTNGSFDAAWIDRTTGETVIRRSQRAQVAWFYYGPAETCDSNQPVELEVTGGVIRATE